MGFLDKLLGRKKKPAQESTPPAPMNKPPAHEDTHDEGEPHAHDEPSHEGEQSPPA